MIASRHAAAALAAVIALAVGIALIATSGGGESRVKAARPGNTFPHTPAGAVAAATTWLRRTTQAFFTSGWESAVRALGDARTQAVAKRIEPDVALLQRRMAAGHTPYLARIWPLRYAVQRYSAISARVRVWQVYALAVASPLDTTGFQTTTVSLGWIDGTWKITGAPAGPDLTPPGQGATASQVAGWITAVDQLRDYTYVP